MLVDWLCNFANNLEYLVILSLKHVLARLQTGGTSNSQ
jgi:hypothetical protein